MLTLAQCNSVASSIALTIISDPLCVQASLHLRFFSMGTSECLTEGSSQLLRQAVKQNKANRMRLKQESFGSEPQTGVSPMPPSVIRRPPSPNSPMFILILSSVALSAIGRLI